MNKRNKIVLALMVSFLAFLFVNFSSNNVSASSSDKPYYTSKFSNGVPAVLRHKFKAPDGSYFKGAKSGFELNDVLDDTSLSTNKIKSQLMLYKKGPNQFLLKSHGDEYYVVFNGSPKNIKKIWINFVMSGIDNNYGTSDMTRVK